MKEKFRLKKKSFIMKESKRKKNKRRIANPEFLYC